ncbi:hypothetical protein HYW46_01955 [Candidatus Daviesbacteria bacterium]|nr:hypothetical protein [Candidatus Daviesbacteria bacterium]
MIEKEKRNEQEREFFKALAQIKSLAELRALIGEFTPEEKALIDSLDLDTPLTEEELEFAHAFRERMMQEFN